MTREKRRKVGVLFDTDRLAKSLFANLLSDFRVFEGNTFMQDEASALLKGLPSFRGVKPTEMGEVPPLRWKRRSQMDNLLKKYRFANDAYNDVELENMTIKSYLDTQERISQKKPIRKSTYMVIQRARLIAKRILGKFDESEALENAKFGKRSSIGCPMSLAYIDYKLSNIKAFTGSSKCAQWFYNKVLTDDAVLSRIIARLPDGGRAGDLTHESLNLVNVPKTWKTLRTITPLTLLSLFYSYGIGGVVTKRLEDSGIDIRSLQERHKKLVKQFSISRTHATADLSAASDSILSEHLNRILPREWYVALKPIMTHRVVFGDKEYYTDSVLPMGNGCTFPVETLYFYCLIKAIGELTKTKGVYSVYGDDLIYPSSIHNYVYKVFEDLSLKLNTDKTFVHSSFRESCGSDYYRGIDVRTFYFKGTSSLITRNSYKMLLYKTFNGLLRRWDRHEIPNTIRMLLIELSVVGGVVFRVPPGFPDTAGIKCDEGDLLNPFSSFVPFAPVKVYFHEGSRWFTFSFLDQRPHKRAVITQEPYYWLALSGRNDETVAGHPSFWETDLSVYSEAAKPPISWEKVTHVRTIKPKYGAVKKKLVVKLVPMVSSRLMKAVETIKGTISDWI
jgi:hypothetical protein